VTLRKFASLAAVLRRSPREFADRVGAIAQGRIEPLRHRPPAYAPISFDDLVVGMDRVLAGAFSRALREERLAQLEAEVGALAVRSRGGAIDDRHNGDELLARCCYAIARVVKPAIIIETGVAHGVSSAFFLAALAENGTGELHSIDLPPLDAGAEAAVGAFVPASLRTRWTLHRGISRRLLPDLLADVGPADVFLHDSLHTYENMRFELEQVWPTARVIIADDVELNGAFAQVASRGGVASAVVRQAAKDSLFGVIVR
jgi:predicted O-methyltransferase YrrM